MLVLLCLVAFRATWAQSITTAPSPTVVEVNASDMPTLALNTTSSATITIAPSYPPTILSAPPTVKTQPSIFPTSSTLPTTSSYPSFPPSPSPTYTPTSSSRPTDSARPSDVPSILPSQFPSRNPSSIATHAVAEYRQRLLVTSSQTFSVDEQLLFQYLYERYTINFGYLVSKPEIVTTCQIKQQSISQDTVNVTMFHSQVFKRRRDQEFAHALSITFTMDYQSGSQYDTSNYNTLFKDYVNQNTTKVAIDMALIGLPVLAADQMIMVRLNLLSQQYVPMLVTHVSVSLLSHPRLMLQLRLTLFPLRCQQYFHLKCLQLHHLRICLLLMLYLPGKTLCLLWI